MTRRAKLLPQAARTRLIKAVAMMKRGYRLIDVLHHCKLSPFELTQLLIEYKNVLRSLK